MSYNFQNLTNNDKVITKQKGVFSVLEYQRDKSVAPYTATAEYFMTQMGVKKKQVIAVLNNQSIKTQAGAMQYTVGQLQSETGVKGVGDLLGKAVKGAVTKESAVKPIYNGAGMIVLEPTYKHIILVDVAEWPTGITLDDGLFLACDNSVEHKITARKNLSSVIGGEGLFNLSLQGEGIAVLESNVPEEELVTIELQNDTLKVDGNMAICWSSGLEFTVERSSKTLIGSAVNGEGLVNVYRGTGKVLLSPVASSGTQSQVKPMATPQGGAAEFVGGVLGSLLKN